MKEKVILSYNKGIRNTPSDMLSEDGELAECVNLEIRDNELTPVEMPSKLFFTMEESEVLLLVHNLPSGGKNYVSQTNGVIRFFSAVFATKDYYETTKELSDVVSIQAIGNTVVIYTEESPYYFLYSEGDYKFLGSKLPELDLSFNLIGEIYYSDELYVETDEDYDDNLGELSTLTESQSSDITMQVMSQVSKFVGEKTGENYFMFPFFVRYAYKLFDGTHTMHSAPILMLPSTKIAPLTLITKVEGNKIYYVIGSYCCTLGILNRGVDMLAWDDIIKGVDVFISRQVYTYDQGGKITGLETYSASSSSDMFNTEYVGHYGSASGTKTFVRDRMFRKFMDTYPSVTTSCAWILPAKQNEDINNEIMSCSNFYPFRSLNLIDLTFTYEEYEIPSDYSITGIETETVLKDDYMTHDTLLPKFSFFYNSRLNISNVRRKLFCGFTAECMTQWLSGSSKYDIYTYIHNSSGSDIVVKAEGNTGIDMSVSFLFYPDPDAYRMEVVDKSGSRIASVDLVEHPLLNGAYWFSSFKPLSFSSGSASITTSGNNEEYLSNTLMLSEVNNPFYFPLEGIYTVGSSSIIGMSAITRPISEGQFGEYPLLAFCSDGNFALRVDGEGYYSGISPVQEDIVLGPDKVVSMENSVAVITQKGIMLTSGNDMTPLAAYMRGEIFDTSLLSNLAVGDAGVSILVNNSKDAYGFMDYLRGSKMAFDYASNRILIYNPAYNFSYFYNFNSNTVTKFVLPNGAKLVASVGDYPDYILEDSLGNLYSLYNKEDVNILTDEVYGFALTRPLKLGNGFSYKSIMELMNIKEISSTNCYVKYRLYGTNNNRKYYQVNSRFGKPYKYYRIAFYTKLLPKDAFVGTALTVDYRRTHKFR